MAKSTVCKTAAPACKFDSYLHHMKTTVEKFIIKDVPIYIARTSGVDHKAATSICDWFRSKFSNSVLIILNGE